MSRFRCSPTSGASGEPLYATASQVRRWVLVEERGPWGRHAVRDNRLPAGFTSELTRRARNAQARVLLIRRHGRYEPIGRTVFVAVTTPRVQRVERLGLDDPTDVLDLAWARLAADETVGGAVHAEPIYLVCTNGAHDPCCAEFGRPVAKALSAAVGEQVWEASHFGGDRFAGNLVCLPDGVYYGRVSPEAAVRLADDYAAGRIDLDHYRGRSSQPFAVQAAEFFVRRDRGLLGLDDLVVEGCDDDDDGVVRVRFRVAGGERLRATVAVDRGEPERLSCHADNLSCPPRYRLLELAPA